MYGSDEGTGWKSGNGDGLGAEEKKSGQPDFYRFKGQNRNYSTCL